MEQSKKYLSFDGRLILLGFGSVAQATLPLLLRHLDIAPSHIRIISRSPDRTGIAAGYGIELTAQPLREENYEAILDSCMREGDFLLNLSVDVASLDLIRYCRRRNILYLDTCIEPWAGGYTDVSLSPSQRSNYALREQVLGLRLDRRTGPTALVTQGANPGLASVFVKQALLAMAKDNAVMPARPTCFAQWAALAQQLDIKVIHIAERDTQMSGRRKQGNEFVNTWSVEGFVSEGLQPSELGWGSHERHWPHDAGRHGYGGEAAIFLNRPGVATRVRSWTPLEGPYHGFLVTHGESISIADHLTLSEGGKLRYRPTVHYAYHPCDDAVLSLHEMAGKNWKLQRQHRIMRKEIDSGMDELGVLLMGNPKGAYWFGSRLSIEQARDLAPHNSATSLQVAAGILGGMVWAIRNPDAGIVEPDDIDDELVMHIAAPYLGEVVGQYSDWTPLAGRCALFEEPADKDDPWQFINFRVA